jgi:hypothetical protein
VVGWYFLVPVTVKNEAVSNTPTTLVCAHMQLLSTQAFGLGQACVARVADFYEPSSTSLPPTY